MAAAPFAQINPEPVPAMSLMPALSFAAGVEGYLRAASDTDGNAPANLRVVLHRVMNRDGEGYLQQLSPYAGLKQYDLKRSGRTQAVTAGAIGWAYKNKKAIRTKFYKDTKKMLSDMSKDMVATNDTRTLGEVARSYLAIPMLGKHDQPVTILYADTMVPNFFAQDHIVEAVIRMCQGFCDVIDEVAIGSPPGVKNYELPPGEPVKASETYYPTIQEAFEIQVPRYRRLTSFNLEQSP